MYTDRTEMSREVDVKLQEIDARLGDGREWEQDVRVYLGDFDITARNVSVGFRDVRVNRGERDGVSGDCDDDRHDETEKVRETGVEVRNAGVREEDIDVTLSD